MKPRCEGDRLIVTLLRDNGKPIRAADRLVVTTNNLFATGARGTFGGKSWQVQDDRPVREELVKALTARGGVIAPDDKALFDAANPRVSLPSAVPVRCSAKKQAKD